MKKTVTSAIFVPLGTLVVTRLCRGSLENLVSASVKTCWNPRLSGAWKLIPIYVEQWRYVSKKVISEQSRTFTYTVLLQQILKETQESIAVPSYLQVQSNNIQEIDSNSGQFLRQFTERFFIEGETNSELISSKSDSRQNLNMDRYPFDINRSCKTIEPILFHFLEELHWLQWEIPQPNSPVERKGERNFRGYYKYDPSHRLCILKLQERRS